MTQGPWSTPPAPGRRRRRFWLAIVVALACAVGVWTLWRLSAGRPLSGEDWGFIGLRVLTLVLVVSAALAQGLQRRGAVRHSMIWLGLAALLFLGFTFRHDLGLIAARVGSAAAPGVAVQTRPGEMVIARDVDGAFYVIGEVNGQPVRFLVDTGASDVVLSPDDARRLGVDLAALDFSRTYQTANGVGRGAPFQADSLSIGSVRRQDIPMSINQAPMDTSLLGMSFFRHLQSVEIRGDSLYLRWGA